MFAGVSVLALTGALLAVGVGAPAATAAAPAATGTPNGPSHAPTPTKMGDYSASRFAAAAAQLPPALADAVERDLGTTPQQYLSDSAAAADAAGVVQHLRDSGVKVTDARIDGTTLRLRVASAADVAAAKATGAQVSVGAKEPSPYDGKHFNAANQTANGGTAWGYISGSSGYRCSVGFNGYGPAKRTDFVTAGHCVAGYSGTVLGITQNRPAVTGAASSFDQAMGVVAGVSQYGNSVDTARVNVTNTGYYSNPFAVSTWGGGTGSPDASPLAVRGDSAGIPGASICKSGSTSGWTCGTIQALDQNVQVGGQYVNVIVTDACVLPGDSGGAAMLGGFALGITSGSTQETACGPGQESVFFPMKSDKYPYSVEAVQTDWELGVTVSTPVVSTPATVWTGGTFSGQVPGANAQTTVSLYWDGAAVPSATTHPDGTGAWSFPLPAAGTHSYKLVASWGANSVSAPATGSLQVVPKPTASRIAGGDRFDSSVQMSQAAFPSPAHVPYVVIANGVAFPDALSAAPAAVKLGGPLLLTAPGYLPASVQAEVQRLHPDHILVVGGPNAVSDDVLTSLNAIAPTERAYGGDRFGTAQAVAAKAFTSTASSVYLVSGGNFPDALSAGAAASHAGGPVLLVPGGGTADASTLAAIDRLHPTAIKVVGGVNVIADSFVQSLSGHGTVTRLAGGDRFATAQAVNADAFASAANVELASGVAFPDALAGSALAGNRGDPLYISLPGCIPASVASEMGRLGATSLTALGGTAALGPAIDSLTLC
ncbi:Putative cell wall-binding protein OS=Leifsonia shinshuensis OX=150026 GN=HNR13_003361 PE=4 SV=1 [Leifsonia shinshuensis]